MIKPPYCRYLYRFIITFNLSAHKYVYYCVFIIIHIFNTLDLFQISLLLFNYNCNNFIIRISTSVITWILSVTNRLYVNRKDINASLSYGISHANALLYSLYYLSVIICRFGIPFLIFCLKLFAAELLPRHALRR